MLKHNDVAYSNNKVAKRYNAVDASAAICDGGFGWGLRAPSLGNGWWYGGDGSPE